MGLSYSALHLMGSARFQCNHSSGVFQENPWHTERVHMEGKSGLPRVRGLAGRGRHHVDSREMSRILRPGSGMKGGSFGVGNMRSTTSCVLKLWGMMWCKGEASIITTKLKE